MSVALILKARDAQIRRWRRVALTLAVALGLGLWGWCLWVLGLGADVRTMIRWAGGIRL